MIFQVPYLQLYIALVKISNSMTLTAYVFFFSFACTTDLQLQSKGLIGKWAQSTNRLLTTCREGRNSQCLCLFLPNYYPTLLLYFWNTTCWKPTTQVEGADAVSRDTKLGCITQVDKQYVTEKTTHLGDREPQVGNVHVLFQRHCDSVG